ncbi:hypothetical protein BYT27DRAFT_6410321 [Phlegmacium glaucopus]|nr:hypothetical protein BYT27DRAFT_6410321 [Phlegmacium glaucopus]
MALYYPTVGIVSQDQPAVRTSAGPLVFSPTAFQKHLQDTKNDSFNCFYIVTALQRHQLKAAAFTASLKACLFRMRYDTPGFLENIEPQFQWIDPAEILIESLRQTPESVTIYTSYRPCSVPHIVIHESPPNDPYVAWNNSTDAQNYCFLTLFSPNPSLWGRDACQTADDCFTDDSSSLYDSSLPATPKDFASTFAQDLDTLFEEDTYEIQHCNDIHQQYGDEYLVPQYSVTPQSNDTTFSSKAKFFIPDDEEEDSLPPLDDWYISIANRCMPPEEAEAVAAAAAVTVSCA